MNRKKKTITKATVLVFVNRVLQMNNVGEQITGSKKIGTFGASYLFAIFKRFGLINPL